MRTRHSLLAAMCCLGAIAPVFGAPASIREQVDALLSSASPEPPPPEVTDARKEALGLLEQAATSRQSKSPDAADVASVLDETALEWAQLSKDLLELAAWQTKADAAEHRQVELEAQLKREKAHLEETEARRGRALATLEKLGAATPPKGTSPTSSTPAPATRGAQ